MLEILVVAVFALAFALGVFGRELLLRWYLHEIKRTDLPENPADAIVTYPLA